ncbi:hypothetical protein HB779_06150 [Phyllobacterium sp. 628]|uniref:hypothetical protein n=1 Tax=Phyllobacterium sp. 628 TaxID=2718938 RepID=UPI0016626E9C|nr:hypothetical protein [Phyllobacterium sp. 628]QND51529.1 hypothetical protein HB779_06150 [Phyllobacterium sp. 628]
MAPPRKPLALAHLSGAVAKNPQRYRNRTEVRVGEPLGPPPAWLKPEAKEAWRELDELLPWLDRSHRCIVGLASYLQAKVRDGTLGVPGMQLLRQVLGSLGATPVSASKINWTPQIDDPDDDLFER